MTMHAQQTFGGYVKIFFMFVSKNYSAVQQFLATECFASFIWNIDKKEECCINNKKWQAPWKATWWVVKDIFLIE